jgi:hypothetical protein
MKSRPTLTAALTLVAALTFAARGLRAEETSWVFQPEPDKFTEEALFDLRSLNEEESGQSGFVRLSEDGMSFVRGDGKPIRFWSTVDYAWRWNDPEKVGRHLDMMAKYGVNMVRVHGMVCSLRNAAKFSDVEPGFIDGVHLLVAECKKRGIYVTLCPFWAHINRIPLYWTLENYKADPWGILFFDLDMQDAYKAWMKELYTRKNPLTGIPLKDDPTVALIQIQNEDSLFFWTFQHIKEPYKTRLGILFGQWAAGKYGSIPKAIEAWGGKPDKGDDLEQGALAIFGNWQFNRPGRGGLGRRLTDQVQFLAETQHGFYAEMRRYLREELGCKQLVNATNWKTSDTLHLGDVERWTYTACDVSAVNTYTGVVHIGELVGYRIDPGQVYESRSVVLNPLTFPGNLKQTVGQPMVITETAWVHPALYQSEGPLMAAAYMSLTGVDSFYWFSIGDESWTLNPVHQYWKAGGKNSLQKWYASHVMLLGQFPACALAFRRGDIQPAGAPVVREERSLKSLWERRVPIIAEESSYDPNRDPGEFAPASTVKQQVDPLAFLVGPVHVRYGGDEAESRVADLSRYIDRDVGIVRSVTGQIELNHRVGLLRVDAPRFQAVAGFLRRAGRVFVLSEATIESENDYAAVAVVSLDDEPLATSRKVLVQVGTTQRLTGWEERPIRKRTRSGTTVTGFEIADTGGPPWRIEKTRASVTLENERLTRATLLDIGGYPVRDVAVRRKNGRITVELPPETVYLVLR